MYNRYNSRKDIKKFINAVQELPDNSEFTSLIYEDSDIKISLRCKNKENKVIDLIIENPQNLLEENKIGFPDKISHIDSNRILKEIIKSFFTEYLNKKPKSKRTNFEFQKYDWRKNKVIYRTKLIERNE